MEIEPRLWAVILVGPPGAGKDTQAELLSLELGLVQIKTSKIIEARFAKADPNDAYIQEQRKRKLAGDLIDQKLAMQWVLEEVEKVHASGKGIIMSGSPRSLEEGENELPRLLELYQSSGLKILYLNVSEEESVKRNASRRVCAANGHPIPNFPEYKDLTVCPQDGSVIVSRQDDTPETIRHRYQVYKDLTQPFIDFLSKNGYNLITINGKQPIEDVHRDILDKLW